MTEASTVLPFQMGKRPDDITVLARSSILAPLTPRDLGVVLDYLDQVAVTPDTIIASQGGRSEYLFFVLEGEARLERGGLELGVLGPGASFGEIALLGGLQTATVVATRTSRLARLSRARFASMASKHPQATMHVLQSLLNETSEQLAVMTDRVSGLFRERSIPRRAEVVVQRADESMRVATGTLVMELVPRDLAGDPVVAALLDRRPVALDTPVTADGRVEPIARSSPDGQEIYARSAGLAVLEAAHRIAPELDVRLGAPAAGGQVVAIAGDLSEAERRRFAGRLEVALAALVRASAPFRQELWTVEEARRHFADTGWRDAASLLKSSREPAVPLVSCGAVYGLSLGPALRDTSRLGALAVYPHPAGVWLDLGAHDAASRAAFEEESASPCHGSDMAVAHRAWLARMGIDCVGAFNEACVSADVAEIVRVSEGFHEKRLGLVADQIAARRDKVRLITVAGPSSSGKTTFIKRLKVQLEINGIRPLQLSTDDYYVDREKTPRDPEGGLDFEALEAIDLPLLQDHVHRLLAGETVTTSRYDFLLGKSLPAGGVALAVAPGDMLLVEGIHGLNPALFGDRVPEEAIYRVFIQPSTALPFDRLTAVDPADLRLLRRIVRDRRHRGYRVEETIARWPSVRRGERHILPFRRHADAIFDSALVYEPAVMKVFAERYLLEVPPEDPTYSTAFRLRQLVDRYVSIYPDHVPPTSLAREFIGGSGFQY